MAVAYRTSAADSDLREIAYQIGVESGRPQVAFDVVDDLIACCDNSASCRRSHASERMLRNWVGALACFHTGGG